MSLLSRSFHGSGVEHVMAWLCTQGLMWLKLRCHMGWCYTWSSASFPMLIQMVGTIRFLITAGFSLKTTSWDNHRTHFFYFLSLRGYCLSLYDAYCLANLFHYVSICWLFYMGRKIRSLLLHLLCWIHKCLHFPLSCSFHFLFITLSNSSFCCDFEFW